MNKIIVVENCRICPYLGYIKRTRKYVCQALSLDVTENVKKYTIHIDCKLDDALIETKQYDRPDIITSEGEAVCKVIPPNDSEESVYLIGGQYHFQRQVDNQIRVYNLGIDVKKYFVYPYKEFVKYFQINAEQSFHIDTNLTCPSCNRPLRYCECL